MAEGQLESHKPKLDWSENPDEALARNLTTDCTWHGIRTAIEPGSYDSFQAFQKLYGQRPGETEFDMSKINLSGTFWWIWDFDEDEKISLQIRSWSFEVAFQEAYKGRSFYLIQQGYLCMAPHNTKGRCSKIGIWNTRVSEVT